MQINKEYRAGIVVYDWMATDWKLIPLVRLVFALVFSYAVAGKEYYASLDSTAKRLAISRSSVKTALKDLVSMGLLIKSKGVRHNSTIVYYTVAPDILHRYTMANSVTPRLESNTPRAESATNNTEYTYSTHKVGINNKWSENLPREVSDLIVSEGEVPQDEAMLIAQRSTRRKKRTSGEVALVPFLLGLGVDEAIARSWDLVRRKKGAVNSPVALKSIANELRLLKEKGVDPDVAIKMACERSWGRVEASWVLPDKDNHAPSVSTSASHAFGYAHQPKSSKIEQNFASMASAEEYFNNLANQEGINL